MAGYRVDQGGIEYAPGSARYNQELEERYRTHLQVLGDTALMRRLRVIHPAFERIDSHGTVRTQTAKGFEKFRDIVNAAVRPDPSRLVRGIFVPPNRLAELTQPEPSNPDFPRDLTRTIGALIVLPCIWSGPLQVGDRVITPKKGEAFQVDVEVLEISQFIDDPAAPLGHTAIRRWGEQLRPDLNPPENLEAQIEAAREGSPRPPLDLMVPFTQLLSQ